MNKWSNIKQGNNRKYLILLDRLENMASMSDFRKKKLVFVFNTFFDQNQSGTIDLSDFELAIEQICEKRGWKKGSNEYNNIHETMTQIWKGLQQNADKDNDGQITVEEWAQMWLDFSKNPAQPLEWQTNYLKLVFKLQDASSDGAISVDEFTKVCKAYGIETSEAQEAFAKLSQGAPEINFEQFSRLWTQFFTSDNPTDPGTFIFGKTKF